MLIEQAAYRNRWRTVSPQAKLVLALAGWLAAWLAGTPQAALAVALVLLLLTCLGAGVSFTLFLRAAAPAAGFLLLSCLSLMVSLSPAENTGSGLSLQWSPAAWPQVALLACRALASLTALLGLALTTPLPDLLGQLRRWHCPAVLLDLMVLCYQTIFVLLRTLQEARLAQQARLGYARPALSLASLGQLVAHLVLQLWQRAHHLQAAALSRNGGSSDGNFGSVRLLPGNRRHTRRDTLLALLAGGVLLTLSGLR